MASYTTKDRNSGSGNAGLSFGDCAPDNKNTASASTQDQVLLQALQSFIVPLIQGQSNAIQIDVIPEARKLITALREFISSVVVRSQLSEKKMIEVDLVEGKTEIEDTPSLNEERNDDNDDVGDATDGDATDGDATTENSVNQEYVPFRNRVNQEKFRSALRDHVFNRMPIRLLSFEPHGTSFQIKLLEREDVYARLVSMPLENIDELSKKRRLGPLYSETEEEVAARFHARYAIISHTWLRTTSGEITYGDWNKGQFDTNSPGYTKLVNFCQTAWRDHGLTFGWMDTICINKDSSSELDESIRSMYKWYGRASVCLVYLADTKTLSKMHLDPWFTRGWTLQELLAPDIIKFYNMNWKRFSESVNDKPDQWKSDNENADASEILENIEQATTITESELKYGAIRSPISRRMQMAANRKVTREEDTAYSLMGIFDISIATAYGEGAERAFSRLLEAILTTKSSVMDIFNWAGDTSWTLNSRILPDSPQNYVYRSTNVTLGGPMEPLTITHQGLRIPLILMPAISTNDPEFKYRPIGHYNATVELSPDNTGEWSPFPSNTHHLLDQRCSGPDGQKGDGLYQTTFAVLNFYGGMANTIEIPKTCLAIALHCSEDAGKVSTLGKIDVYQTTTPIVFNLEKSAIVDENDGDDCNIFDRELGAQVYQIKMDELPKHGMQLVNLYL